jgi:hypothetical protein
VLHQILLSQAAGSLLRRSVPNACLGADRLLASSSSCHSIVGCYFLVLLLLLVLLFDFLDFFELRRPPLATAAALAAAFDALAAAFAFCCAYSAGVGAR